MGNKTGFAPASSSMPVIPPERLILALPDTELEKFARDWVSLKKQEYVEVERFTGPGDMGRDVVGFITDQRHEGPWDNYQCKQYGRAVSLDVGLREIGKILYYASRGEFTPPTAYFFVAPKGVSRSLRSLISKPNEFKTTLLANWDEYCAEKITGKGRVDLDDKLKATIGGWSFSNVHVRSVDHILSEDAGKAVMVKWFGDDPGPAPLGNVPPDVEAREMPYVRQLLDAYGERDECSYADHGSIQDHGEHKEHLDLQRERFFDADAFSRFYRDNTMSEEIDTLRHDMLHGVSDVHRSTQPDSLARVDAVMAQAANVQPSGVLSRHARVPVKQGICHHFANEGRLIWRRK